MPDIISLNMTSTSNDHMGRIKLLLVHLKTERWIHFTPCYVLPATENWVSCGHWFSLTSVWPQVSKEGICTKVHKLFLFNLLHCPSINNQGMFFTVSYFFLIDFFSQNYFLSCKFLCSILVKLCTTCPTVIKLSRMRNSMENI